MNTKSGNNGESVDHPPHYNHSQIECIDAISSALTPEEMRGFIKGNAIKYLWRANHKSSQWEDLNKALWYLQWLIKKEGE